MPFFGPGLNLEPHGKISIAWRPAALFLVHNDIAHDGRYKHFVFGIVKGNLMCLFVFKRTLDILEGTIRNPHFQIQSGASLRRGQCHMDPLCISLVHQYLDSTNSALADQFKDKYDPHKTNLKLEEVLSKWKEGQMVRGLIYQHLKTVAPFLAVQFRDRHDLSVETVPKHLIGDIQKKVGAITGERSNSKVWDESWAKQEQNDDEEKNTFATGELLVKSLIHEHLKTVAPSLALDFHNTHLRCSEPIPDHLIGDIQKKVGVIAQTTGINKFKDESGGKQKQISTRKKLGVKPNTFTSEELVRIKNAMANNEDIESVAKEMGRSCTSVRCKIYYLRKSAGLKKGKFSVEEIETMKQALENNEDYKNAKSHF